jgi:hypothetical protein
MNTSHGDDDSISPTAKDSGGPGGGGCEQKI